MTQEIEICRGGCSEYTIVIPSGASQSVRLAARELQDYLEKIYDAKLPISHKAARPAIRLLTCGEEKRDRFKYSVSGKDVLIQGGNDRSVLYGVYAFLEACCGVRFFSPDFEWVPKGDILSLSNGLTFELSASFFIRALRQELGIGVKTVDWMAKNYFNAYTVDYWQLDQTKTEHDVSELLKALAERGIMLQGSGHAMHYFLSAEDYFAKHPDWFPEEQGRRIGTTNTGDNFCYSNIQAVETFTQNLIAFCKKFPCMRRICIWPGDGGVICSCEACRQKPFQQWFAETVAHIRSIFQTEIPHVVVSQLAYNSDLANKTCTQFDVPKISPPLPVMFAFWGQNLSVPLGTNPEPSHQIVYKHIKKISFLAPGQTAIFSYHTDTYMNSDLCPIFTETIAEDFHEYKRLGIDEVCLLWIPWQMPETKVDMRWLTYQNGSLWGRVAMNVDFDVWNFREWYHHAAFGFDQAKVVGEAWRELNEILSRLQELTFPVAPRRFVDAWGCGFNPNEQKWILNQEDTLIEKRRRELFQQVAEELITLWCRVKNLRLECTTWESLCFKEYIHHCAIRAQGLSLIFLAQGAMREGRWESAVTFLQNVLDLAMPEEAENTRLWLMYSRRRICGDQGSSPGDQDMYEGEC